ncbi:hypothetical protein RFI_30470 [Reticulomyxa filosa]|uniref:Uncharacterized protein n=1 Tax=Reticulomyxa filosa TaxID=46433 RepID=X6M0K0_RETFI|nr:hypothetical protein RFI_30470 [Reticulomyxa filosa]|eukprot:ETO06922.1 hypothetical protein RFI_30470 [Reticulomyxa filosa]
MNLWEYGILCLAGRSDWVPYSHLLKTYSSEMRTKTLNRSHNEFTSSPSRVGDANRERSFSSFHARIERDSQRRLLSAYDGNNFVKNLIVDKNQIHYYMFDFENLVTSTLCSKTPYRLEFEFSDTTLRKLSELIYLIPYHPDETTDERMDVLQALRAKTTSTSPVDQPVLGPHKNGPVKYGRPVLILGSNCCKDVHLSSLKDLYVAARGR